MQLNRLKVITLVVLAALDGAGVLFAWSGFAATQPQADVAARPAPRIVPAPLSEPALLEQGEDSETLARPLFVKSRRPPKSVALVNGARAAIAPPGMKLHAVIGFNRSSQAFVTSDGAAAGQWLKVGDLFENWTIESIMAQEIALRRDEENVRVGLDYDSPPATPGSAPPPPPSPPPPQKDEGAPPAKSESDDAATGRRVKHQ